MGKGRKPTRAIRLSIRRFRVGGWGPRAICSMPHDPASPLRERLSGFSKSVAAPPRFLPPGSQPPQPLRTAPAYRLSPAA